MTLCLIIGGLGQDGYFLSKAALAVGLDVVVTTREFIKYKLEIFHRENDNLKIIKADPYDADAIANIIHTLQPFLIFNLAAQSSVGKSFQEPSKTYMSCIVPTLNIVDAIKSSTNTIKFFHASSGDCFGSNKYDGGLELPNFKPNSPYAAAKVAAGQIIKQYKVSYEVLGVTGYLYNHESVRRGENFVFPKIFDAAFKISKGANMRLAMGNVDIVRDWGCADEYMQGVLRYMMSEHTSDFMLGTGTGISLRSVISRIFENYNLCYEEYLDTDPQYIRQSEIKSMIGTNEFLHQKVNWKPSLVGFDLIDKLQVDFERHFAK